MFWPIGWGSVVVTGSVDERRVRWTSEKNRRQVAFTRFKFQGRMMQTSIDVEFLQGTNQSL